MQNYLKGTITLCILTLFIILNVPVVAQGNQDRVITSGSLTIRLRAGGPDLQFYSTTDAEDSQLRWRYQLSWKELIEFTDVDGDGLYTPGTDTKVGTVNINTLNFDQTEKNVTATGVESGSVDGKELDFVANFTYNSQQGSFILTVAWYDDAVVIPYGSGDITVEKGQSKYSVTISDWAFENISNRLAFMVDVMTTTNLGSYNFELFDNGTLSMITKENPDGKGKRGGIIHNPSTAIIDSEEQTDVVNSSLTVSGNKIDLQYSFSAFESTLFYDPTFSAVVTVTDTETDTNSDDTSQSLPGFELTFLFLNVIVIAGIRRIVKGKYN